MTTDWSLPASPEVEHEHARRIAAALRAEADTYGQRIAELRAEMAALQGSRWSCIVKAAAIERELRGLE